MSATGLFVKGFAASEVLAIQNKAKALLLEGKTLMNWSDNGTSVSKQFAMPVEKVLEECAYALAVFERGAEGENAGASSPLSSVAWRFPL